MAYLFKHIVISSLTFFLVFNSHAQFSVDSTWNLDQCISYARVNNLDLKLNYLSLSQSVISKKQAAYSYFPTLSANGTHGYNWGQKIDPFTNQFANNRVQSNNFNINSNVTLFSGLRNYYTSQKTNSEYLVQKYTLKVQERDLKIDVSALFLQTLMNLKTIEIVQEQILFSLEQNKRIRILVEQEHKTEYDLLEVESQLGLDSLALIKAKNEYNLSVFRLKQFLNIKADATFVIDSTFLINEKSYTLTEMNYSQLEENLLVAEQVNSQAQNIKITQSGRYPSLTLSASIGSGYSGNNRELIGTEFLPKPFNIQVEENFYQSATISLNIPIFNRNEINSQIQSANIELKKAEIQKDKTLLEVENKIQQLIIEIDNANSLIYSTEKVLNSLQKNFNASSLKYDEGTINYYQFLEVKNTLIKTEMELLQAQFEYFFKKKILEFYFS